MINMILDEYWKEEVRLQGDPNSVFAIDVKGGEFWWSYKEELDKKREKHVDQTKKKNFK